MKLNKQKFGWWKSAVFYQVYPKSFQDTNGDGIGDLKGIISRLDYLENLGIDGIWLSPVCQSPQVDNGYDISDYRAIDPSVGTMEEMLTLIREAKARGISIILDLVPNHSSDQHPWFLEAKKGKDNPYHDYYIWRDAEEGQLPNGMRATFGGPAWTYVPELGQYYFHQFAPQQPDLNWENPKVRQEIYDIMRFWVAQGVEGFRLDVVDQIGKDPELQVTGNGPRLHEYLREMSAKAFLEEGLVVVGEAWGADVERAKLYSAPDRSEMSMVFQFQHMCLDQEGEKWDTLPLDLVKLKKCYESWQQGLYGKGWNSLFLNNHDLPRIVSRWGDEGQYRVQSAKMLATMLHGMQGTPYIYQGEELGMTNVKWDISQYADVETLNLYKERTAAGYSAESVMASIYARGRDNARTPMQWTAGENAGFTDGKPWLNVNENYTQINAEAAMADENSVFHHYRKLIALRKELDVFREGNFLLWYEDHPDLFVYSRSYENRHMVVVCNFSKNTHPFRLPEEFENGKCLISNYPDRQEQLRPYESYICYYEE